MFKRVLLEYVNWRIDQLLPAEQSRGPLSDLIDKSLKGEVNIAALISGGPQLEETSLAHSPRGKSAELGYFGRVVGLG